MGNQLLFFFSSLGAFNGLIIGIYFLAFSPRKKLSTYFLGALLLALSIRIGKSVAFFFDYNVSRTILQIGLTACTFIGPFLYFFILSELKQIRTLPSSWKWQLITWTVLILGFGILFPYERQPFIWTDRIIPVIYFQWGCYVVLSIIALVPTIRKMFGSVKLKPFETWLLATGSGVALIYLAYVWAFLNITRGSYIVGPLYFSLILYLTVFTLLYRRKTNDLFSDGEGKSADRKLPVEDANYIISKLEKAMQDKELFKNPNLKMNDVAREIHVTPHQLSRVLNSNLSKNFTQFVNEYRINEACKMLVTESNLTVDAISFEVGFNSKSTFFSTFKKYKGMTPSAFQQFNTPEL